MQNVKGVKFIIYCVLFVAMYSYLFIKSKVYYNKVAIIIYI